MKHSLRIAFEFSQQVMPHVGNKTQHGIFLHCAYLEKLQEYVAADDAGDVERAQRAKVAAARISDEFSTADAAN